LLLVIDSNEYILAFGPSKELSSKSLLDLLLEKSLEHSLRISRLSVEEIRRHLTPETFREFTGFISSLTTIDEDFIVPFELGAKYESKGLKPPDAFIAAYVEWVGADVLVTENRHFLTLHIDLPFRILQAEKCLNLLKANK
jgi:predicted nucleic acid-binding protein